ncbi:MAG: hypothetical protein J5I59_12200 [Saprospiraceae bacterium]|nr:hypothetical protein [Saprospiraceae bacterium]
MKYLMLLVCFCFFCLEGRTQVITDHPDDTTVLKEYAERVKLTRIDGKYIPRDLNDAIAELNKIMEDDAKNRFKSMSEDEARKRTHFSFGKYINARWHILDGSRLTAWFRDNKIYNADDMIDCVIAAYHRSLNNQPIQFEQLAEYYYKKQQDKLKKLVEEKNMQHKGKPK